MPKRSLNTQIEQLNRAINVLLTHSDGQPPPVDAELEPLVRVAAALRELPRDSFKAHLKSELKGRKTMSAIAEPKVAVHPVAVPRLTYRNAAKAIEFYKEAFGAREVLRFEIGDSIPHAELAIGDSTIFVTEEWPEGNRFSAETLGNSPVLLTLRVDDVDSFAARAVAAGMTVKIPIRDQFYGSREGTFVDPFGYSWSISTLVEEMSVEEMHRRMKGEPIGPEGGDMPGHSDKPKVNPIPRGFQMVSPYLVAADGPALLDFIKAAFDAEETFRTETPRGGVHGEIRFGDSMMMAGGGIPGRNFPGPFQATALHVYVRDCDAVIEQALAAGATLVDAPRDQEYGERSGTLKDPAGNVWYVATAKGENYTPKGLRNVNVYLHPKRAEPLITFLKRAFSAKELAKYATPDGVVMHAEMGVGDSVIEMGEAHDKYETMTPMLYLYVPDVDALYRQAVAAGATSFQEPADQPYGDRNAGLRDNFGNTWYIATHVKDVG
jgi:PhnB protein